MGDTPLIFNGRQTIEGVEDARQRLLDALAAGPLLTVECSAVEDADAAFLQLLVAASLSARSAGGRLALLGAATGPVADRIAAAGLTQALSTQEPGERP
ncbi:MAG: hypothetical protein VR70_09280 [Rhodospirillaceae bacterium BRH_c57]|nr:MAG: hypothetical protein VR70_09280 [Rhodospirillaceae bacterium BRH_c57]